MQADHISSLLKTDFEDATVLVEENGGHYHITVVSIQFSDLRTLARQQLVYKVLGEHIANGSIHAVVINAHTPDEWLDQN